MRVVRIVLLLVAAVGLARADAPPLAPGEQLVYSVAWLVIPGAGRITVNAHATVGDGGRPCLSVVTETETRGLAKLFLPFHARAESIYDDRTGRLIRFSESSTTRDKKASHTVAFDYAKSECVYTDGADPQHPRTMPLPRGGDPMDLVNCLLAARAWNLAPGQARDALVLFEDDFYQLTVHALGYEEIDTMDFGTVRTLLLEPWMERTPPKGMFKRGSTVRVWIAQDGRHLPIQFKVQFKFGSGIATLTSYRPGAAAVRAGSAPVPAGQK